MGPTVTVESIFCTKKHQNILGLTMKPLNIYLFGDSNFVGISLLIYSQ